MENNKPLIVEVENPHLNNPSTKNQLPLLIFFICGLLMAYGLTAQFGLNPSLSTVITVISAIISYKYIFSKM